MKLRHLSALTLLTVTLAACSGGPASPPPDSGFYQDAPGYGAAPPAGAQTLSPADFEAWFKGSGAHFETEAGLRQQQQQDAAQDAQNEQDTKNFVSQHPEFAGYLLPRDGATGPDGDVPRTVPTAGGPETVLTLGRKFNLAVVADHLRNFPTAANQLRTYTLAYGDFKTFLDSVQVNPSQFDLPDPTQAAGLSGERLLALNNHLTDVVSQYQGSLVNIVLNLDPAAAEVGAGDQLDRNQTGACKPPSEKGIYKNMSWPLKNLTTSVKQQGGRGTCWGFATVAALEIEIAKRDHKLVNLAEQDYVGHRFVEFAPRAFGDGGDPLSVALGAVNRNYEFAYEKGWQYNKSWSRQEVEVPSGSGHWTYQHSCDGYSGVCSDTNYQGGLFCTSVIIPPLISKWVCGYALPTLPSRSGYRIGQTPADFWDYSNVGRSLTILLLRSVLGNPTVVTIDSRYLTPDADGYVADRDPMRKIDDTGRSVDDISLDHVVTITGFVSNEQLAKAVPGAPGGAGGGYFIVKNSWGDCWGDVGYAYVPFEWARKYVGEAITGIQP